jgi:hypothetical protein
MRDVYPAVFSSQGKLSNKFTLLHPESAIVESWQFLKYPQSIVSFVLMQSIWFLFNDANLLNSHVPLVHNT